MRFDTPPAFAETNLRFEEAADAIRDAVLLIGAHGDVVWANRSAAELMGRSPAGHRLSDLLTPESAQSVEFLFEGGSAGLLELHFIRPDLDACALEVDFNPVTGSGAWLALGRRISDREFVRDGRQRAQFQALQFQLALVELSRAESGSLKQSLAHLTAVAASTLDVARVSVWLFNDDHSTIRCIHRYDRDRNEHSQGGSMEVARYPRHFDALENTRTIAASDSALDPLTRELAGEYLIPNGTSAVMDVPIRREGRTVGVLCHEHTGGPRLWRLDEQNFGGSLADLVALILETDSRRQAERAARKSLDQLELFFSQSLDGFFFMMLDEPVRWDDTVDKEAVLDYIFDHQRLTKANDAMVHQYGAGLEELIGMTPRELFGHDLAHGRDLWRRMLDHGRLHVESDERRKDGSRLWIEGDYICFYDAEGRVTGHFGIQRDISERKRYTQRLALLQHMDRAILSAGSVFEIARAALGLVHELVPCRRASVAEFDLHKGTACLVGVYAPDGTQLPAGSVVPLDVFGSLDDLRSGKPYILSVAGVEALPEARARLRDEGILWFVNVPLVAEGVLIGALNLGSASPFSAEHVEILREVADSLAVALRHAQLNVRIARHAAELELRVAERTAELKQANARLAGVFRSAMDAFVVLDASRRILIFNPAAEKMFRCSAAEVAGEPVEPLLSAELAALLENYIAASGSPAQMWLPDGLQARRKSGEQFLIEGSVSRAASASGDLFTIILRDINDLDHLLSQNVYLRQEIQSELNFEEIVGASPVIERVFQSIEMVAATDSTVLLLGETGTGKELIARAVHNRSKRRQNVCVKVNCGALPANLVESELFGHEKGAFTGATGQKKGRFELANHGTIFLDEVGELPLDTQTKLLRILQEQEFERVGGSHTVKVDVRVIAATNRDLQAEVKRGAFRMDLFYRLNVFPIQVPALRERKEDIPLLAAHFVQKFSDRMGKRIEQISRSAADRMQRYDWPGNVRELANVLERAVILCQGSVLEAGHLGVLGVEEQAPSSFPTLEEAERRLILQALERTGGVLAGPNGAAQLLGLNRSTLWSRMRKLGIE